MPDINTRCRRRDFYASFPSLAEERRGSRLGALHHWKSCSPPAVKRAYTGHALGDRDAEIHFRAFSHHENIVNGE